MPAGKSQSVIIIGAGIAGLAAAAQLGQAGIPVVLLEARDRIGGRIFTKHDPASGAPIELGAEFIHGLPSEIWDPLRNAKAEITEVSGQSWCESDAQLSSCDFFSEVDSLLESMDDSEPDESFLNFLDRCFPNSKHNPRLEETKRRAIAYVSGFNAADPGLVGVHWLVQGMHAEARNQGDRAFRSKNGYTDLLEFYRSQLSSLKAKILTDTVVRKIAWKPGLAEIAASNQSNTRPFTASHVLITLPVSLLKNRTVEFVPDLPSGKHAALEKIEMGKVIRIVLRFRHRFWETIYTKGDGSAKQKKSLSDMSFLFSDDEVFPTWWTTMPDKQPLITGWAPFRGAEILSGKTESQITAHALQSLSRLLGVSKQNLEDWLAASYVHDWQNDPFSQGAYSYGRVGADGAQHALGAPVENTLFFAGEATDTTGNNGTVHGATASGRRAAAEIIRSLHH